MQERTPFPERQAPLPDAIGKVATGLADCFTQAGILGVEVPDYLYAHLLDLESWAHDVRTGRVRALHLVGGIDLET